MSDIINHPSHYQLFPDTEVIQVIKGTLMPEEYIGYLKGSILKYRLRAGNKGPAQVDIDKATWYRNELTAVVAELDALLKTVEQKETRVKAWEQPDYCESERYEMTGDMLHDDSWRAETGGPGCTHKRWYHYQSTHTKSCTTCGHIEPWNGG